MYVLYFLQSPSTCDYERDAATADGLASPVVLQTPEQVRAHPKADARKRPASERTRTRKRKTAILTDTPVKKQLETQAEERKSSSIRGARSGARHQRPTSHRKRVRKVKKLPLQEADADDRCSSCGSLYGSMSDKRIKEQWFQCSKCSRWAHESCGNVDDKLFYCLMCIDSDNE